MEQLAFKPTLPGEADLPEIHADPLPKILTALRTHTTFDSLSTHLPDITPNA